jgi:hypothetical protein
MPQFTDQARQSLGPDPHLERLLLNIHPLDEQLDDARLLGREQLVPDRGEVSVSSTVTSRSAISWSSRLAIAQVRATSSGAASSFWMWSSTAPSTSAAGTLVAGQLS